MLHVADDGDVAHEVGVGHQRFEEVPRVHRRRRLLLDEVKVLGLYGRDDRLRDRLRVLLLYGRLDLLAVDLDRGRVILFVLVQHDPRVLVVAVLHLRIAVATDLQIVVIVVIAGSLLEIVAAVLILVAALDFGSRVILVAAVEIRPDVIAELVVEVVLLVHCWVAARVRARGRRLRVLAPC